MNILKISFRNLNRQKRRSILLVIAVAFAFLIVTFIDGLSAGVLKSMEYQFGKMIGGHVYIASAQKASDKKEDDPAEVSITNPEIIEKAIKEIGVTPLHVTHRSILFAQLIFEGKESSTNLYGCDFDNDTLLHESITFREGNWENMKKENAILLSEETVKALDLKLHDIILCECKTDAGQQTVAEFQVEGISVSKSALMQVATYINLAYLNKITQAPAGRFQTYSIYLKNMNMQEDVADKLEKKLAEYGPVTSRQTARMLNEQSPSSNLDKQLNNGTWSGTKYMVASMYDFAPQLATLITYVHRISLGVLLVLLAITMIGVSNTFRMIVHERKSEIGTMRSCGVSRQTIRLLFIAEALFLAVIGAVVGIVLAIILMQIISFIYIPTTSAYSVFTADGYFKWKLSFISVLLKFMLMIFLTLIAAHSSASKASNMIPAEALRVGK